MYKSKVIGNRMYKYMARNGFEMGVGGGGGGGGGVER